MEETIYRGLDGVNVDTSEICFIDGEKGELIYRGYDIAELTEATYEEVVYLLWEGELPTQAQLDAFRASVAQNFAIPDEVVDLMRRLPTGASPMHALRTAVSALASFDPDPDGVGLENVRRIGTAITAVAVDDMKTGPGQRRHHRQISTATHRVHKHNDRF